MTIEYLAGGAFPWYARRANGQFDYFRTREAAAMWLRHDEG